MKTTTTTFAAILLGALACSAQEEQQAPQGPPPHPPMPLIQAHFLISQLKPLGMQEDALIGLRHLRHFVEHGRPIPRASSSTSACGSRMVKVTFA